MEDNKDTNIEETTEEQIEEVINENYNNEYVEKRKTHGKTFSILLILAVMSPFIIFGGTIVYNNIQIEKIEKEKERKKIEQLPLILNEVEAEDKKQIRIYKDKYGKICYLNEKNCEKLIATIKTESEHPEILTSSEIIENGFVVYKDNNQVKLYDIKNKKSETYSEIDPNYEYYYLIFKKIIGSDGYKEESDELLGISYENPKDIVSDPNHINSDTCKYYDVISKKHKFNNICIKESIAKSNYLSGIRELKNDDDDIERIDFYLVDIDTEKVIIEVEDASECAYAMMNNDLIVFSNHCFEFGDEAYYTKEGKKLTDYKSNQLINSYKNKVYYTDDSELITIVDYDGNKKEITKYKDYVIKKIRKNHAIGMHNNELLIINLDTQEEIKLDDWKDNYYFHTLISGYYDTNRLSNEKEKRDGYYILYSYSDNFDGETFGPSKEVYFNPETKEIDSWELENIGGYAKPVLYLYPTTKTNVKVSFEHNDNLTTTYPKFKDSWNVTAYPNGDLYDENNKYYYGLYWEEKKNHQVDFNEGFYVEKDNAIEFLEEKLSIIGLNAKERNEFIMYWLPILEKNEKNIVYFELTEEREKYNKINIEPKPDSLLRMAIHVKKVNNKVNIKEQQLKTFNRTGFSAVEWGGVQY